MKQYSRRLSVVDKSRGPQKVSVAETERNQNRALCLDPVKEEFTTLEEYSTDLRYTLILIVKSSTSYCGCIFEALQRRSNSK